MMIPRSHHCTFVGETVPDTATPDSPAVVDSLLDFELKRKSSTTAYESGDTILVSASSAFLDLDLTAQQDIASVTVTDGPLASPILQTGLQTFQIRMYVSDEVSPYEIAVTYANGESWTKILYLGTNVNVPVGHQIEGYTEGQELPSSNNEVTVTLGANPKPHLTFKGVALTIYRDSDGQHMSQSSSLTDDVAGILKVSVKDLPSGNYTIRTFWRYDPESENVLEDTPLIVAALPPDAPGDTFFQIHETEVFTDGRVSGVVWTDPSATNTRQWLTVDGVEYDRPLNSSLRTLLIPLADFGMDTPGAYTLQWHSEYSDTNPTVSSSDPVVVTVQAIPVATLLDTAIAAPDDDDLWSAVLASSDSTAQQRAIAADMIAFNEEVAAGTDFGIPLSEVLNDRSVYLTELEAGATNKTFALWLQQQADLTGAIEQQEARDFFIAAPTSSVSALLAYFNQQKHPWGSVIRLLLGGIPGRSSGDWQFIRDNAQSYGGPVADTTVLSDYRRYQAAIPAMPLVQSFETWTLTNA